MRVGCNSMAVSIDSKASAASRSSGVFWLGFLQDAALVSIFSLFAFAHGHRILVEHVYTAAPFFLINAIYAFLFLTRRRSRATTTRWQDWLVASIGGFGPLALQVQDGVHPAAGGIGFTVQLAGLGLACVALGFLGRSFGIVAADRGLKTSGAYGMVRHPIYFAHVVTEIGFIIANPHWVNAALIAVIFTAQILRIRAEERLLESSTDYAAYKQKVRYRLIPGVY